MLFKAVVLSLVLVGCGGQDSQSVVADVGTDILSASGSQGTSLYWKNGDRLVRGRCTVNLPVLRRNCQNQTSDVAWNAAVDALSPSNAGIAELRADKADIEALIVELNRRIEADPNNQDLISERNDRQGELTKIDASLSAYESEAAKVTAFFALISDDRLTATVYRQAPRYEIYKPYLHRLAQYFSSQSASLYEWTDPTSGRSFRLSEQMRSQNQAACGFGWNLIACADAMANGAALLNSPLRAQIAPLSVDGQPQYLVWTSCLQDSGHGARGIALRFDPNSLSTRQVSQSIALQALCTR